jgi:hypothetical protein
VELSAVEPAGITAAAVVVVGVELAAVELADVEVPRVASVEAELLDVEPLCVVLPWVELSCVQVPWVELSWVVPDVAGSLCVVLWCAQGSWEDRLPCDASVLAVEAHDGTVRVSSCSTVRRSRAGRLRARGRCPLSHAAAHCRR